MREFSKPGVRFIARVSGLPSTVVDALGSSSLTDSIERLAALEAGIRDHRAVLTAVLHDVIGGVSVKAERNRLLEMRRDLNGGRLPSSERLEFARRILPIEAFECVDVHCAQLNQRLRMLTHVRELYSSELNRSRAAFQSALGDSDFQKGVLTSSATLFRNIARYRNACPESLGSRDEQIERGLLRYFTRAAMKATPFATLCSVAEGEFANGGDAYISLEGNVTQKRGFVRLNKVLFGRLWSHLRSRSAVRQALPVELNPTLEVRAAQLRFLASFDGREVFQRMARNEVLDLVVSIVKAHPGGTLASLIERLVADPDFEVTDEEAKQYVESLIAAGLFRMRSVVPEQEADWDIPLLEFLVVVDDEHAAATSQLLMQLRPLLEAYRVSDVDARIVLLNRMKQSLTECFALLGIGVLSQSDLPVFEDASVDAVLRIADSEDLRQTLEATAQIGRAMSRIAGLRSEQMTMRHFFAKKYVGLDRVPLLTFYEDFYREHFKEHLEKQQLIRAGKADDALRGYDQMNPMKLPGIYGMRNAANSVTTALRTRWADAPDAREIQLPLSAFDELLNAAPKSTHTFLSLSTFGQLLFDEEAGRWRFVFSIPSFHAGFGKYFSRFLYALPATFLESVREANCALSEDIIAEIAGDSQFNANLHPPLLPTDISHPSGEGASDGAGLPAANLDVVIDPNDQSKLQLIRRTDGRRVHPVDLGFLNPFRRPPLFQLLSRFGPMSGTQLSIPDVASVPAPVVPSTQAASDVPDDGAVAAQKIVYRPRLVIGDRVVVARCRWTVPNSLFPKTLPGESAADHFLRVNLWRLEQGIPERIYVRIFVDVAASPRVLAPEGTTLMDAAAQQEGAGDSGEEHEREVDEIGIPNEIDEIAADARTSAEALSIPDAEIVSVAEGTEVAATLKRAPVATQQGRASRDYQKPQFIDFSSPIQVALFGRLPVGLKRFHATIEECYPAFKDLPAVGGNRYTTELVLQFDFVADSSETTSIEAAVAAPEIVNV